jgi:hypothetical protein
MKKNFIIALLIVISILSLSYGFYQKKRADEFEAKLSKQLLDEEIVRKVQENYLKKIQRMQEDSSISLKKADDKTKK